MNFFLILFFVSFFAIFFMIGRKLFLVKNNINEEEHSENLLSGLFDFEKLKYLFIEKTKKIIHILTWIILRIYIISANFINKE